MRKNDLVAARRNLFKFNDNLDHFEGRHAVAVSNIPVYDINLKCFSYFTRFNHVDEGCDTRVGNKSPFITIVSASN